MAENPDRECAVHGKFAPSQGDLRFVEREITVPVAAHHDPSMAQIKKVRILQRWEWSYTEAQFDWYDVPLTKNQNEEAG